MTKYNHAYDFAFEVVSDKEFAEDVTPTMMIEACRKRIDGIAATNDGQEMKESCGLFDTYKIEEAAE